MAKFDAKSFSEDIWKIYVCDSEGETSKGKQGSMQGHHFPSVLRCGLFAPYVSATRKCEAKAGSESALVFFSAFGLG